MSNLFLTPKRFPLLIRNIFYQKKHPKKFKKYIDFKKLLENKKVCLVGPAEYVDKEFHNHGKIIDSFDIVIRINNFINTDESLYNNYGKRMDVLITSLWHDFRNTYCHKESYSEENIDKPLLIYYQNGRLKKLFISFFLTNDNITICEQPKRNLDELLKLIKNPTTGMIAVFECLKCSPEELYITGFTFGGDKKHKSYVDKYYKFWTPEKKLVNEKGFAGIHNVSSEFDLIKKLIKNNKNFVLDPYLRKEIFHLDY